MPKNVPVLPGIQPSKSAYSQVVEANGLVFVAGQVGEDPATGEVVPGGIAAETRAMFTNVERCLAAVGLGLGDIVKSTVYLVDMDDWAAYNAVFREVFPKEPPTRATVAVSGLVAPYRIEVEVIAAR
ncbi:MAG: RidA family protein [Chloroflexota bacterium]|nr:RidA family protein [Chloroflexota bacterium]